MTPDTSSYPYQRQLYYVYKNPASPSVQSFLGYVSAQDDALSSNLSRIID
ncbi:MAG: hypothetical protein PUP91_34475 [Rhizonema sp. PD37]|nr:hypothetical protein [Rhizonema sp. PD37]